MHFRQLRNSRAYEVVESAREREERQRQLDEEGAKAFDLTPGQLRVLEHVRAVNLRQRP